MAKPQTGSQSLGSYLFSTGIPNAQNISQEYRRAKHLLGTRNCVVFCALHVRSCLANRVGRWWRIKTGLFCPEGVLPSGGLQAGLGAWRTLWGMWGRPLLESGTELALENGKDLSKGIWDPKPGLWVRGNAATSHLASGVWLSRWRRTLIVLLQASGQVLASWSAYFSASWCCSPLLLPPTHPTWEVPC